jgi:pimeloyl-ACP methyl ester carboxylesterase
MARVSARGVPYLLILGTDLAPDVRARIDQGMPTASIEVWPGSGHFPHLAHPDRLAARLAATAKWTPGSRPVVN